MPIRTSVKHVSRLSATGTMSSAPTPREPTTLQARVLPKFPTAVVGVGGIQITKQNGVYTFSQNPLYPLADAPADGLMYGRLNNTWQEISTGFSIDWDDVVDKPATFPPSAHSHAIADVTGLQATLDDKASIAYVDARTPQITVGATPPSSPAVGDIWIDTSS